MNERPENPCVTPESEDVKELLAAEWTLALFLGAVFGLMAGLLTPLIATPAVLQRRLFQGRWVWERLDSREDYGVRVALVTALGIGLLAGLVGVSALGSINR